MSELVDKLYHYTSLGTFLEFILPQKKLKFSGLGKSRDPYESLPHNYARIPFWEDDCSDEKLKQIKTRVTELNQYWQYSRFVSFVRNKGITEHKGFERRGCGQMVGFKASFLEQKGLLYQLPGATPD